MASALFGDEGQHKSIAFLHPFLRLLKTPEKI
jgi:hypothetical protein